MLDVIIVGGGPAGLAAALVLGRCRRRAVVFDTGQPRNRFSHAMHGFLSRDCMNPGEFLEVSREQLKRYETVELRRGEVTGAERRDEHFQVTLADGSVHTARILLLASGLTDHFPPLEGFERFYGTSVHHCPYCDGWEHRDQSLVVYGQGQPGADLALELLGWTRDVTLCTDGAKADFSDECDKKLECHGIRIIEKPIGRLEGEGDQIRGVRFRDGEFLPCGGLFFATQQSQCSPLAEQLGCEVCCDGVAIEHVDTRSDVPGLYVAGNNSRGLQLVIMAAASGTLAAFNINQALLETDVARAAGLEPPEPQNEEQVDS